MCGINGIFEFSTYKKKDDLVQGMNDQLKHRGPDAEGVYKDDFIHLGHRRLSIIDVDSRSNQPFISEDAETILVFNGEIYNYKEIRAQLTDYNFKTDSDTEVVLAAFLKWGEKCLRMFNGMFALAIWSKPKKELFIARDRLGIKPLYYVLTDNEIIFSSSVKSILSTELLPRKIREDSLIDYLRFQTVHAPFTLIDGLFMLMSGQQLLINDEVGIQFTTYWNPNKDFRSCKDDVEKVKENIRSKLRESVNKRLVGDVPFGAFLSGGIDSSIIVALMDEVREQKVDTFSVVFKENGFSEAPYAREIAEKFKTNHHEIELSVNEFKDLIPEALSFMDHPSGDGPNTFVVSKKTKESGVKMALSGLGGDELFGGYSIFNQIKSIQDKTWLKSFPSFARKPMAGLYHGIKGTVASSKIKALLKQDFFDTEYIYQFYRQTLMDDQIRRIVKTSKLPINRTFQITHDLIGYETGGWKLSQISKTSVAEISTYMQNVLLRDSDQMSMAHGLEVRIPFLDHEFVEYVLGIPDKIKQPLTPKKLLVDSFKDVLPQSIYDRPKMGFVLPYDEWIRTELKSFCEERLDEVKNIPIFRPKEIDRLWSQFLSRKKRIGWSRIWPLVVLGDWIKTNNIEG